MATALQVAANRRNAKKSTGPRSADGKKRASLNHVKHGMTAKTVILLHESANDYDEIREALIKDYAPATTQELMLVDQIAAGYWRTIRSRRFETAMFDNQLRTAKRKHGKDTSPNSKDDEGCAVILQVVDQEDFKNYFRYDAAISRDYYRAIATLEKMQAARRREQDRAASVSAEEVSEDLQAPEIEAVDSIGFVSYSTSGLQPEMARVAHESMDPLLNLS
jgi:hypothetical protein